MGKPVLLSVDDDPGVSRAVARDLRRQYGADFRVLRASSGREALEALRELKLRGDTVAAFLADYRMPQMNGIEFLEQAMDLFPRARRALLTAYADTEAAIQAINIVDVDFYLLKPWDPPDEKLYPVVDQMIQAWRDSPEAVVDDVKLIGHRWSAPSFRARDLLARNAVPYRWYSVDEPEGQRLLAAADAGRDDVPVVITPDGVVLRSPTETELAGVVGLSVEPQADFYDLVVVGGGPAGLGAAVYGASEGLRTVLVEREATGGQAGQSSRIENYLGFPDGVSGGQLAERARRQAAKFGAELLLTRDCVALEAHGSKRVLRFADGSTIAAHAVVLATGVSYRSLGVAGADDLTGRGVYYGSAMTEAAECADEKVFIVGGANSAGQAAAYFARYASSVHVLVRGPSLEASMSHYLVEQLDAIANVHVHTCTQVAEAHGTDHLEQVTLRDARTGEQSTYPASHLFVFIGGFPRTQWLDGVVVRDDRGFIPTGPSLLEDGRRPHGWTLDRDPYFLESSLPGVFVAGDARAESVKRVASAVGEGAMAVTLVHRYLGER
ncbi:MAG: response regulator receiver modulated FAD-dependent pyridine nucleotide-disulfide oxidoreductase [Blastococcus sp.]|jgi:thioredoxin reductase (NADPH)|nr:response regulator receiver modulated FAD-dependent pyridine nucleotide-disulfide oxidoreductase [Blastococcus sp.]